jgi:hypothetical protein
MWSRAPAGIIGQLPLAAERQRTQSTINHTRKDSDDYHT